MQSRGSVKRSRPSRSSSVLSGIAHAVAVLAMFVTPALWFVDTRSQVPVAFLWISFPIGPLVGLLLISLRREQRRQLRRLDAATRESRSRERSLTTLIPTLALIETDLRGDITDASESSTTLLGAPPAALVGRSFHEFTGGMIDLSTAARTGPNRTLCDWSGHGGILRQLRIAVQRRQEGEVLVGYRLALINMDELVAVEDALRESREAFVEMLESAQNGIMVVSGESKILLFNSALARIVGYEHGRLAQVNLQQLSPPDNPRSLTALASAHIWGAAAGRYERQLACADGSLRDVELSVSSYPLGYGLKGALIEVSDITERKQAGAEIERLAHFDQLTGLPNRRRFEQAVTHALEVSAEDQTAFAVLLIDLDRFKLINDTLGHQIGDLLLQQVASRLVDALPDDCVVSRFGGDEFVVLAPLLASPAQAQAAAEAIVESLIPPFQLNGQQLHSAASVGVAVYPRDGTDAPTLLRRADSAMYRAKALGGSGYQFVGPAADLDSQQRLRVENDLRGAIEQREFAVYYQPEIDLGSGAILGFEALLRWNHPTQGLLSPSDFIPILEENGLIRLVDEWVMQEACLQGRRWSDAGLPPLIIAVNVSARSFPDGRLVQCVRDAIESSGIQPQLLELEVTETAALEDVASAVRVLRDLRELGVRTALDDFGTGHSSLIRLKEFPLHTLKVDGSFVEHMTVDDDSAAIVGGVIALGHALGLTVVAEGVEHERQLKLLRSLGCDLAQGVLFARPMPAIDVTELLSEGRLLSYKFAA